MAEKIIKNPDTESAYQYVPGQEPAGEVAMTDQLVKNPDAESPYQFVPGQVPATHQPAAGTTDQLIQNPDKDSPYKFIPDQAPAAEQTVIAPTQTVPAAEQSAADATGTVAGTPAGTPAEEKAGKETGGIDPSEYTFTGKQLAQMGPAVEDEPGKPQYLTDWSKVGNVYEEAKKLNLPLAQVLQDYQRWGNETGNPTYWINAMFQDADLSKSVADNEEAKKMQERKERWEKVNNFLLHLGNAIGNVGGKGYASMKLEDPVKWGERQRLLKEKALEQRRLNNKSIYQQMRQGWADQRTHELQKQRLENEKLKAGLQEELAKARRANDELRSQLLQKQIEKLNTMTPLQADTEKSKAEKNRQQGKAAITRAYKTGSGRGGSKQDSEVVTTYDRDPEGKVNKSVRKTTYGKSKTTKERRKSRTQL